MIDAFTTYAATAVQSDFFAGGLALGVLGAVLGLLRLSWATVRRLVLRYLYCSVTIDNRTAAYRHICVWIDRTGVLSHVRRVRVADLRRHAEAEFVVPDVGRHWFRHSGRLCILDRSISEKTRIGGGYRQRPLETLTLTMAFGRVSEIQRWIDEGRVMCEEEGRIGPGLHVYRGDYWEALGDVPRRPLESVLCEDDRIERLIADLRWFQGARDWYAERGVPWRRGYLLYGPPGTGKSSLVRVVASELDLDIATLEIGRPGLCDDDLCEAMSKAPQRSLIAMEDIDALFVGRETGEKRVGVSFSGLLNAIDGVAAQEGRPVFMTTNHRERLDPALIRPGRADVHVELGPVGAEVAARLFARFFPERPDLAARFRLALDGCRVTPAALQGWLLEHLADPEHAAGAAGLVGGARLAAE